MPASLSSGVTSFTIAEAGIQWTVYDFGRTAGHYGQAVDRAKIEELSMARRQQTVAFEVAQCYFRLLAAQSNLRVQEEALRQAESILADTKPASSAAWFSAKPCCGPRSKLSQVRQDLISARQVGPGLAVDAQRGARPIGANAAGRRRRGRRADAAQFA